MENKNNGLIVVTKSIFDKIKDFFKNIFSKKVTEEISHEVSNQKEDNVLEVVQKEIETNQQKDKKEFFKKYNELKEGKISASDFTGSEKVKLNLMLDEELNINSKKLEKIQNILNSNN